MKEEDRQRARHRDHRVAVGDPADGRAVRVVDGVEERGQPGAPRRRRAACALATERAEEAQIDEADGHQRQPEPQNAVQVHEERRVGPQRPIEHVRQRRQRAPERQLDVGIGPPRKQPGVDEPRRHARVVAREREQIEAARADAGPRNPLPGHQQLQPVVRNQPRRQRRRCQRQAERHREPDCRRTPEKLPNRRAQTRQL